jgi:putative toxin-antitoxin system antitoxin component (TIGR02293 family)
MSLAREYTALTNLPAPQNMSVNDLLFEGLPITIVGNMTRLLHVDKSVAASMLDISLRRINQLSSVKADESVKNRLNKASSEKALLVTRLFLNLCDYFGNEDKAQKWFNMPNRTLGNKSPSSMCTTYFGIEQVSNTLNKLKHGFTA